MGQKLSQAEFDVQCREVHGDKYICLDQYVRWDIKLRFKCKLHGIFKQRPNDHISQKSGCPKCGLLKVGESKRGSITDLHKLAKKNNGICLSSTYYSSLDKYKWKCSNEHIFYMSANSVSQGSWCPKCVRKERGLKRRKNLMYLQNLAKHNNGFCLSMSFIKMNNKYLWKCEHNHKWKATGNAIQQGSWCQQCAGTKKKSLKYLHKIAKKYDGICLSKKFTNVRDKYLWKCKNNHKWKATADSVSRGHWCMKCSVAIRSNKQRGCISDLHKLAKENNGKCLSKIYTVNYFKYEWRCNMDHKFKMQASSVQQGHWCPICKESKGEKNIRKILMKLNIKIERQYKYIDLIGRKKQRYRFDFYLKKYNLLIEYDGEQHFKCGWGWNKLQNVKNQQKIDLIKNQYCKDHRIKLIRIPYTMMNQIEEIITREYKKGFPRSLNYSAKLL